MLLNAIRHCRVVRKAGSLGFCNSLGPHVFDQCIDPNLAVVSLCMSMILAQLKKNCYLEQNPVFSKST